MNKKAVEKVMPVMEGATFFNFEMRDIPQSQPYHDQGEANAETGIYGWPVFLWVGRLDDNKDPLMILDGFEILSERYTEARLYMIYGDDRLANKVKDKIDSSDMLKTQVILSGQIEHNQIEQFYKSAHFFVLGSHYEGSGYALSEAMRCGCIPIVTDIPSFRMMTNNGQLGALWKPGDKDSFVKAAIKAIDKPLISEVKACIVFFNEKLSFDAIARDAMHYYQTAIDRRNKRK
jgi:glycosyltransferase involved in cell wall biosynthesis